MSTGFINKATGGGLDSLLSMAAMDTDDNVKKLPASSYKQPKIAYNPTLKVGNPPAQWVIGNIVNRASSLHFSLTIQVLPKGSYQIRIWAELFSSEDPHLKPVEVLMSFQKKAKLIRRKDLENEMILAPECREFHFRLHLKDSSARWNGVMDLDSVRIHIQAEKQELIGEATKGYENVFTSIQTNQFTFEIPPAYWIEAPKREVVQKRKREENVSASTNDVNNEVVIDRGPGKRPSIIPDRMGYLPSAAASSAAATSSSAATTSFVERIQALSRTRDYERLAFTQGYYDELKRIFERVHKKFQETERTHAKMDRDQFRAILNHDQMVITTLTQGVAACRDMANLARALNPQFYDESVEGDSHWAMLEQMRQIGDRLLKK